jgi:hypothetical protein
VPIHPVLGSLLRELKKKSKTDYLFQEEYELYVKHPAYVSRKIQQHFRNCEIENRGHWRGSETQSHYPGGIPNPGAAGSIPA